MRRKVEDDGRMSTSCLSGHRTRLDQELVCQMQKLFSFYLTGLLDKPTLTLAIFLISTICISIAFQSPMEN